VVLPGRIFYRVFFFSGRPAALLDNVPSLRPDASVSTNFAACFSECPFLSAPPMMNLITFPRSRGLTRATNVWPPSFHLFVRSVPRSCVFCFWLFCAPAFYIFLTLTFFVFCPSFFGGPVICGIFPPSVWEQFLFRDCPKVFL